MVENRQTRSVKNIEETLTVFVNFVFILKNLIENLRTFFIDFFPANIIIFKK